MVTAATTAGADSVMSSSRSGEPARHDARDIKQRRRRRIGRNHAGQRGEKQRRQEEDRDEERRQPGAAASRDAGRALDIARRGRGADQRTEHGGETIGDQRLLHARKIAFCVGQPARWVTPISVPALSTVDEKKAEDDDEE